MKKASGFLIILCLMVLFTSSSCAVVMAAKQPNRKDLGVLTPGIPRDVVVAELGSPVSSEMKDGKRVEIYKFKQGYSGASRAIRTIGHGALDVFTLGLWEAAGTPIEAMCSGNDMAVKVIYGKDDKVLEAIVLKGKPLKKGGKITKVKEKKARKSEKALPEAKAPSERKAVEVKKAEKVQAEKKEPEVIVADTTVTKPPEQKVFVTVKQVSVRKVIDEVRTGMTLEQVEQLCGPPLKKMSANLGSVTRETWIYRDDVSKRKYRVMFENGMVVA